MIQTKLIPRTPSAHERPYALVVARPEFADTLTAEGVRSHLEAEVEAGKIKRWYVPDRIVFVPEIPKTSVGKLDKKRIRGEMKDLLLG